MACLGHEKVCCINLHKEDMKNRWPSIIYLLFFFFFGTVSICEMDVVLDLNITCCFESFYYFWSCWTIHGQHLLTSLSIPQFATKRFHVDIIQVY